MSFTRIQNFFENSKTVCVGRLLLDVPESAEVVYGTAQVPTSVFVIPGKGNRMEAIVRQRLEEIETEREYAGGGLLKPDSVLGTVRTNQSGIQKTVFGVSKRSGIFYQIHSYTRVGDDLFVQKIDARSQKEEYEKQINVLNNMASLFRSRGEHEVPSEPGICIEDGFISDPPETMREYVTIGVRLAEFPDVHFSLLTINTLKWLASDAIEPRLKEAEHDAIASGRGDWYARIKTLRRGPKQLNIWKGYEVATHLPPQKLEGDTHEFRFVSQGVPKNPMMPLVDMQLRSGMKDNTVGGAKPSVSDDEALAIWDRLTSSVRVRPVSPEVARQSR